MSWTQAPRALGSLVVKRLFEDRSSTERAILVTRAVILATAVALLAWPLTVTVGVMAACTGAVLGVCTAEALHRERLRTSALLGFAGLAALLGLGISQLPIRIELLANLLGPVLAFRMGELLLWLTACGSVLFALRLVAARRPLLGLLEVLLATVAFAASFAAHRQGVVSRPLSIGDWAWSRGFDPAIVLLLIGGSVALLLALLLISETRGRRLPLHLGILALLGVLLTIVVRLGGLPMPRQPEGLGLTGEEAKEQGGGGGKGGGGRTRSQNEFEFQDEYQSDGKNAPVAVVVLHDDYSPPSGYYYFRQSVMSQYNGRRLVQATRDDVDRDVAKYFPSQPTPIVGAPETLLARKELRTSIGLMVDHVRPFALDSPSVFSPIPNPDPLRFRRAFEVQSRVPVTPYKGLLGQRAGVADWTPDQWRHYTEAPSDPRYGELARALVAELQPRYADDPLAKALAIKKYLDEKGIYSLKSGHAGAADPTASFLFGNMTGYCVHFAHAATYMFRSVGIPARVATGYAVSEEDRGSGSALLIRGGNAHAWPEIYLEGAGWTVVDISPETTLDEGMPPPDESLQSMLGEMMRKLDGQQEEFVKATSPLPSLAQVLQGLAVLLLAFVILAASIKVYRRAAPRFAQGEDIYRLGYRAALDRLADVGLRRRMGETRESFAERARAVSPAFELVTEQHLRWALGSRRLSDRDALREIEQRVPSEIGREIPLWRRALGLLNPFSWWGVR